MAGDIAAQLPADQFLHLAALNAEHVLQPDDDFGDSFDVGLDLVPDGIERLGAQHRGG